jgi:hypothetical protein
MHIFHILLVDPEISRACIIWQDYLSCVYDIREGKMRIKLKQLLNDLKAGRKY